MGARLLDRVTSAVASVDDPEMPGVSIVDLGLLEHLGVDEPTGRVHVGLIPTFTGCPALGLIRDDVVRAVRAVDGVHEVSVTFLASPVWTIERISTAGRARLGTELGIAVSVGDPPSRIGNDSDVSCPRCGSATREESLFGPTRCRAVHRCTGCGETVEVMR